MQWLSSEDEVWWVWEGILISDTLFRFHLWNLNRTTTDSMRQLRVERVTEKLRKITPQGQHTPLL